MFYDLGSHRVVAVEAVDMVVLHVEVVSVVILYKVFWLPVVGRIYEKLSIPDVH